MTAPTTSTDPKETTVTNPNTTVEPAETAETDPKGTPAPEGTETAPETGEEAVEESDESKDIAALKEEAKKRRRELRAVEADRDRLAEIVKGMQRAEVERLAGTPANALRNSLRNGADLWMAGVTLEDLLTADGKVSGGAVRDAVKAVLKTRPYLGRGASGIGAGVGREALQDRDRFGGGGSGWSSVLKGEAQ